MESLKFSNRLLIVLKLSLKKKMLNFFSFHSPYGQVNSVNILHIVGTKWIYLFFFSFHLQIFTLVGSIWIINFCLIIVNLALFFYEYPSCQNSIMHFVLSCLHAMIFYALILIISGSFFSLVIVIVTVGIWKLPPVSFPNPQVSQCILHKVWQGGRERTRGSQPI